MATVSQPLRILSWNVGVMRQAFYSPASAAVRNIVRKLGEMLSGAQRPDIVLMQEWGLHEEGLPEDAVVAALQEACSRAGVHSCRETGDRKHTMQHNRYLLPTYA